MECMIRQFPLFVDFSPSDEVQISQFLIGTDKRLVLLHQFLNLFLPEQLELLIANFLKELMFLQCLQLT